jgi:cytochrome c biogenesis protein
LSGVKEKGFWSSLWDSLSSVRLTISLLIILAVASIFGTVIPQNASLEEYLGFYKVTTYKILRILGFLDMYHAGWFVFLLVLLSLNLVACTLKRIRPVLKFFVRPGMGLEEGQWKAEPTGRKISLPILPEDGLPLVQGVLGRSFGRPKVLHSGGSSQLFAEKGRFSRVGFFFIHLSILIILGGALIGLFFGFRGYMNIVEGEAAGRVILRSGQQSRPLGFNLKLDKFIVSFYPSGAPREFKSLVTIQEDGRAVGSWPIRVNHPLTYDGISFYQASYGIAGVEKVVFTVQDRNSGREITVPARMGTRTDIPGTAGVFVLNRFMENLQGAGPAFQVVLSAPNRPVETFWVLQSHPDFEVNRSGPYRFRIKEIDPQYYSGLQVTKDPGVWVVWIGCILLMAGFCPAFFVSHRRVWIRLTEKKGGTLAEIAGSSHRNRLDFEKELDGIAGAVRGLLPAGQKRQREDPR